jgi:hypothetical protein
MNKENLSFDVTIHFEWHDFNGRGIIPEKALSAKLTNVFYRDHRWKERNPSCAVIFAARHCHAQDKDESKERWYTENQMGINAFLRDLSGQLEVYLKDKCGIDSFEGYGEHRYYDKTGTQCTHSEIEYDYSKAVLDSLPTQVWGKCKKCGLERYYPEEIKS